jgi:cytochrome c oxidase subunit 2
LLTVQVSASQWWWGLRYQGAQPDRTFTTANEIHIPVGQPIRFELASADVVHSFWIPQLAGKMDVIPGQTNVLWLQANKPGTYRGQCAA